MALPGSDEQFPSAGESSPSGRIRHYPLVTGRPTERSRQFSQGNFLDNGLRLDAHHGSDLFGSEPHDTWIETFAQGRKLAKPLLKFAAIQDAASAGLG